MIIINIIFCQEKYKHYNYDQIIDIFTELSHTCSHYLRIDTSQARYNLDSSIGCGENKNCTNLIVFLTDFDSYTLDRPAYYISGILHGDEVIGPSSVTEFAKYFCDSYKTKKNSLYHNILKSKLIILTPMTNAYGYYNGKREEKIFLPNENAYKFADPNRDFPYYNSNKEIVNCMRTITGRTINEIFNEFIIGGAITFHGGTSVLGYPWGNYLHAHNLNKKYQSTESPDYNAFYKIGKIMVKYSSSKDNLNNYISDYILGDMTSTVYPLDGALEDWAYGGWENKEFEKNGINLRPIKTCKPDSYSSYEMIWNNNNSLDQNFIDNDYKLRCLIYLAEASNRKNPERENYGINNFNSKNIGDIFDFYQTTNFFGHIPRNMRLMYSGIDLISASIFLDIEKIQRENDQIVIPFLFMGCLSLKKYTIHKIPFEGINKSKLQKEYLISNLNENTTISEFNNEINCYFHNLTYYNLVIQIQKKKEKLRNLKGGKNSDPIHYFKRPGGNYDYLGNVIGIKFINNTWVNTKIKKGAIYIIKAEGPDESWKEQENPDPKVKPQSHVVRSKLNSHYFIKNGNYTLKSNYYFYSYPIVVLDNGEITIIDDVDSFFYEHNLNFMNLIISSNDKNFKIHPQFFCKIKEVSTNYLSSETIFEINLNIDILEKKRNYLKKLKKYEKSLILFSQMLLNDENEIYHLKPLECEFEIEYSIFIKCNNILKGATGRDIRQKLANSILVFELKEDNNSILNFFGQVSLENDNKGKYFVDYYSKNDQTENNKMLCTSNYYHFIYSLNQTQNNNYFESEIYYYINISKISTTKLKLSIYVEQNNKKKYNYFVVYFPYYNKIEIFDINKKIFEKEINLNENANGKIIGKTVYLIPLEDELYSKANNIEFQTNNILSLRSAINNISENINYDLIPCSIMSYNSFRNEKSFYEFIKMNEKFDDLFNNKRYERFIFKHFLISSIILILLLIIIFYIIIKAYKKSKYSKQFDEVRIDDGMNGNKSNLKC